jgi:hypothetical protein
MLSLIAIGTPASDSAVFPELDRFPLRVSRALASDLQNAFSASFSQPDQAPFR